jgi:hypothetical protein
LTQTSVLCKDLDKDTLNTNQLLLLATALQRGAVAVLVAATQQEENRPQATAKQQSKDLST